MHRTIQPIAESEYYNLMHGHSVRAHAHHDGERSIVAKEKIPVTVIAGFLGSGKTSLLNHIVSNSSTRPVDVLVREYGSMAVDDAIIHGNVRHLYVFPGISLHFDPQIMLYGFMDELYERSAGQKHHLIMEASGLDEPEYLVRLFLLANIRDKFKLSSFVTVVDAEFAHISLDEYALVQEQVAYADCILINKIDCVDSKRIDDIRIRLKSINGLAAVHETLYGRSDVDAIWEVDAFAQLMNCEPRTVEEVMMSVDRIKTVCLKESRAMDKNKINRWLEKLFHDTSIKLLRSKGFFYFAGSDYVFEFQGVRTSFHSKAFREWQEDEQRSSTVVFIGEGLDQAVLQNDFLQCLQEPPSSP